MGKWTYTDIFSRWFRLCPFRQFVRVFSSTAVTRQAFLRTPLTPPKGLAQKQQIRMTSKVTDWVKPGDTSGEFKRQQSSFRNWISREQGAKFPPEKGRYHLYVSYACPWACRTLITRKLKGLEDIISYSVVHWHLGEKGWRFVTEKDKDIPGDNVIPDP
ncbi:glutathione S-transferase, partial [Colletotrichum higginsianum]